MLKLMARILPPSVSKLYAGRFAARGVDLVQGVVTKVSTNAIGKVCGVELRDGSSIEADAVVVGIGARANTALLEGVEGVELAAGGVAVDAGMRTGAAQSSIFAIGDIAAFPGALGSAPGELRRFEHVDCARKTAARCAESLAALLGGAGDSKNRSAFEYLPYCYSRILGCDWAIYGSRGADDRLELLSGDVSSSSPFQLFWVNPSTSVVTAALLDGCSDEDKAAARTAVETGAKWPLKAPSRM